MSKKKILPSQALLEDLWTDQKKSRVKLKQKTESDNPALDYGYVAHGTTTIQTDYPYKPGKTIFA